jgi:chromosome segregation ATPase
MKAPLTEAWPLRWTLTLTLAALLLPGCQSAYYGTMEAFGVHKRDILVDRVEEARDDQSEAKEQFQSALDQFMAVVDVEGGDLETKYNKLKRELDRSESSANRVRERIDSVESVGEALFAEWEAELEQYTNPELRDSSEQQLRETRRQFDQLVGAMNKAESKMDPVLAAFRDHVLFLKHNLNARAIASLEGEVATLESDVTRLVAEMQASIDEADAFISTMGENESAQ